jgi:hypothetical protein
MVGKSITGMAIRLVMKWSGTGEAWHTAVRKLEAVLGTPGKSS